MKNTVAVVVGVVLVFAMLFGCISYTSFLNRNKEHVYSAEELFAIECGKRGGNPSTENGRDTGGSKDVRVKEYKCEGVPDVRN